MRRRTVVVATAAVLAGMLAICIVAYLPTYLDHRAFGSAQETERSVGRKYEEAMKAYRAYLSRYPRGQHAKAAQKKVQEELPRRIELREWQAAADKNTARAYDGYIKQFPDGKYVVKARESIGWLEWARASSADTMEAYRSFVASFPAHPGTGDAKHNMEILERAEKQFTNGSRLYLYHPVPSTVTTLPCECTVSFVRSREIKGVTGKLIVGYVFSDGTYVYDVPLAVSTGAEGDWVSDRRGELTCTVRERPNVDYVVLVFAKRMDIPPLSNQVTLRCTAR